MVRVRTVKPSLSLACVCHAFAAVVVVAVAVAMLFIQLENARLACDLSPTKLGMQFEHVLGLRVRARARFCLFEQDNGGAAWINVQQSIFSYLHAMQHVRRQFIFVSLFSFSLSLTSIYIYFLSRRVFPFFAFLLFFRCRYIPRYPATRWPACFYPQVTAGQSSAATAHAGGHVGGAHARRTGVFMLMHSARVGSVGVNVRMRVCVYACVRVCMYVCVYVCMRVCMCARMCDVYM
jgi:hypothetical protein